MCKINAFVELLGDDVTSQYMTSHVTLVGLKRGFLIRHQTEHVPTKKMIYDSKGF